MACSLTSCSGFFGVFSFLRLFIIYSRFRLIWTMAFASTCLLLGFAFFDVVSISLYSSFIVVLAFSTQCTTIPLEVFECISKYI